MGRVIPGSSKLRGKDGSVLPSAAVQTDNNNTTHDVTLIHRTYCENVCAGKGVRMRNCVCKRKVQ